MSAQHTFDFTCKHCNRNCTIEFSDGTYDRMSKNRDNFKNLSIEEKKLALAMHNLELDCFDEILKEYKDKIKPGVYVGSTTYDDDAGRDAFIFGYVHKLLDNGKVEVWSINTSARYIRKGGEFVSKHVISVESAVLKLVFTPQKLEVSKLRDALEAYSREVRKQFLKNIVEAETEALAGAPLETYDTAFFIDEHSAFLKECNLIEKNMLIARSLN